MTDIWAMFATLDKDRDGTISVAELIDCSNKGHFQKEFVNKWLNLFDADGDGVITMEEFQSVLGLKPHEDYIKEVESKRQNATNDQNNSDRSTANKLMSDGRMTDDMYEKILGISRRAVNSTKDEYGIAEAIKRELDETFGRAWHALVSRNAYSTFISYEEGTLVQFKLSEFVIQVWKTISEFPEL